MNPSLPPDEEDQPMSLHDFMHLMKSDPDFVEATRAAYEKALTLPETEETAPMRLAAERGLRALKAHAAVHHAEELLVKGRDLLTEAMKRPVENLIPQLQRLTDDASDHLLDASEPRRTRLMKLITELRQMVREMGQKRK